MAEEYQSTLASANKSFQKETVVFQTTLVFRGLEIKFPIRKLFSDSVLCFGAGYSGLSKQPQKGGLSGIIKVPIIDDTFTVISQKVSTAFFRNIRFRGKEGYVWASSVSKKRKRQSDDG